MIHSTLKNSKTTVKDWKAKWIWDNGSGKEQNSYYYFRKEFSINYIEKDTKLYITADTKYKLYINGVFVGRGVPQSQPFYHYYNIHNVERFLTKGINCIAVLVNYTGNIPDTRGGLLAEMVDNKKNVIIATDGSWSVMKASAWQGNTYHFEMSQYTPFQEFFDARKVPGGWIQIGFNDKNWQKAAIIKGLFSDIPPAVFPWAYLTPRDIPYMREEKQLPCNIAKVEECIDILNRMRSEDLSLNLSASGTPLKYSAVMSEESLLTESGDTIIKNSTLHLNHKFDGVYAPSIILDFGKIINAYLEITVEGVEGGIIDIGYAERLFDGHFNNSIEGQFADRYIMVNGAQKFETFTWKAFRYIKLLFHSCYKEISIKSVKAIKTIYPFEDKGCFKSNDSKLNKLFDISRYTIRLCSNEFITDTPWREQAQFLGDVAAVTMGGIYSCFGDVELPEKFIKQSAANQLPTGFISNITNTVCLDWMGRLHPDFSLWWIHGLWNHYLYTGKEYLIHKYYPSALRIINALSQYIDNYGMISNVPYLIFIDWADIDRGGECAALNAIFYGTLELVRLMADISNDSFTSKWIKEIREGIRENFSNRFYNKEMDCYVDSNLEGRLSKKISEHTNCAAILWELCDERVTNKIVANFYQDKNIRFTEAQPFFTSIVLKAMDRIGRFDIAIKIIRDRWIKRMVDRDAQSTYEEWGVNGSWRFGNEFEGILRTQSHAWSAFPAEFLIKNLIGLEILEPGCKRIKLNPKNFKFDYEVIFPTPLGEVKVCKSGSSIQCEADNRMVIVRD